VGIFDVVAIIFLCVHKEGDARWNPKVNLLKDEVISMYDVVTVASQYGGKIL
jgi:hypothetical protein